MKITTLLYACALFACQLAVAAPPPPSPPQTQGNLNSTLTSPILKAFPIRCNFPQPVSYVTYPKFCREAAWNIGYIREGRWGRWKDRRQEWLLFKYETEHRWASANGACSFFWVAEGWSREGAGLVQRDTLYRAALALTDRCTRDEIHYEYSGRAEVTKEDTSKGYSAGLLDFELHRPRVAPYLGGEGGNLTSETI